MNDSYPGRPVVEVEHVAVVYKRRRGLFAHDSFEALRDVSFNLYHGESLGIIGRNGAGKSTLLRLLAGILEPDRGCLVTAGLKTALLSLQVGFDGNLSGRYNAILSGMLLGFGRRHILEILPEIIAFAELEEFIDQPLRTYSTGMRARLGFSVAFHLDPDILLIDEVIAVGDEAFRKKSYEVMEERIRSDRTIVLVSHTPETLHKLCNRVVWIEDGETRLEGGVKEVLAAYQEYLEHPPTVIRPSNLTRDGRL